MDWSNLDNWVALASIAGGFATVLALLSGGFVYFQYKREDKQNKDQKKHDLKMLRAQQRFEKVQYIISEINVIYSDLLQFRTVYIDKILKTKPSEFADGQLLLKYYLLNVANSIRNVNVLAKMISDAQIVELHDKITTIANFLSKFGEEDMKIIEFYQKKELRILEFKSKLYNKDKEVYTSENFNAAFFNDAVSQMHSMFEFLELTAFSSIDSMDYIGKETKELIKIIESFDT